MSVRRGMSLNRSGTTARWLMVVRRRLMLLLLLLDRRMRTRSRMWGVALRWHSWLLLSTGMVVHVLRGIVMWRGSLDR